MRIQQSEVAREGWFRRESIAPSTTKPHKNARAPGYRRANRVMPVILHITEKLERHGGTPRKLLYLVRHGDPALRQCFVTFVPGNLDDEMRAAGGVVECAGSTNVID